MDEDIQASAKCTEASIEIAEKKPSKSQLKKERKRLKWEAFKHEKRLKTKEKRKERIRIAKENGETLPVHRKKLKQNKMEHSQCKQRIVVDCAFDDLMSPKDIMKMSTQLRHCYSANRRAANPAQFYVTSVGGATKNRLDCMENATKHWDVHFKEEDYLTLFPKEDVVYLSSESDNVLDSLDENKVYVIGGLVDHNHHKGLCHRLAEEKGLEHAQLPITQYIQMYTRKILTVNQVYEILLYYTETKDWEDAFFRAIPQRKGAITKNSASEKSDSEDDADETDKDHKVRDKTEMDSEVKDVTASDLTVKDVPEAESLDNGNENKKTENSEHLVDNEDGIKQTEDSENLSDITDDRSVKSETTKDVITRGLSSKENSIVESKEKDCTTEAYNSAEEKLDQSTDKCKHAECTENVNATEEAK